MAVTPATIQSIPPGTYTLILRLAGYQDFTTTITISAGITTTPPTAQLVPTVQVATICTWIPANGGIHPMPVANISSLISAYLGYSNAGFTVSASHISGAISYYLGYVASGNSMAGCSLI